MLVNALLALYVALLIATSIVVSWYITKELLVTQQKASGIWDALFEELQVEDSKWSFLLVGQEDQAKVLLEMLKEYGNELSPLEKKILILKKKLMSFGEIADLLGRHEGEVHESWIKIRGIIHSRL